MNVPSPIVRRGGTLMSRIMTSLLALALSNALYYLWQIGFIPTLCLSLNILAYVAQAVGSSVGAYLDYHGHVQVYKPALVAGETLSKQLGFYLWRIRFLPVGLGTFVLTYEWLGLPYVASSCLAAIVGWVVSYRTIDKHFLEDKK